MKNFGSQIKTSEVAFINKVQEKEERISGIVNKIEKCIHQSEKTFNIKINPASSLIKHQGNLEHQEKALLCKIEKEEENESQVK